jgi:hypothetical protein
MLVDDALQYRRLPQFITCVREWHGIHCCSITIAVAGSLPTDADALNLAVHAGCVHTFKSP